MMFLEKGHQKQRKHIYFRKSSIWFPEFGTQRNGKGQKLANGHALEEEKQTSPFPNDCTGRFFADQFENLANFRAHYDRTGPEIWKQTDGSLHAFVAAAGTRGTMAGVSFFLKLQMMIRRKRIWIIQMMIMMISLFEELFWCLVLVVRRGSNSRDGRVSSSDSVTARARRARSSAMALE